MFTDVGGPVNGLLTRLTLAPGGSHLVEIYEDEGFLAGSVAGFLGRALRSTGAAVVVATAPHRAAISDALGRSGIDVVGARQSGRLVELDAQETLDKFMLDGSPDRALFELTIGAVLTGMPAPGGDVVVFGEMVALLRSDGNGAAVVALEDLWNDLADRHRFALLCAYPASAFADEEAAADLLHICDLHTGVIPGQDVPEREPGVTPWTVSRLQQQLAAARVERDQARQALERVRELDRLRSEFLATLGHDIRGPLAVAAGYLDLLRTKQESLTSDQVDRFIANGLEAAARIGRLVDDMLSASSLEAMEFTYELRVLDVGEVVQESVDRFCRSTGADVDVFVAPGLPAVRADGIRQAQIIENLLTRAVNCSPPGCPVRVVVGPAAEGVRVSVMDRGSGFDASEASALFSPFAGRRGDEGGGSAGSGNRLGLWIAKLLVEGQGGTISASCVRGHGSTLTFTVPAGDA